MPRNRKTSPQKPKKGGRPKLRPHSKQKKKMKEELIEVLKCKSRLRDP